MPLPNRIQNDPAICGGQPVIQGTRVLVRAVLGYLAHGETIDVILREFPSLTEDDVRAVIAFSKAGSSPCFDARRSSARTSLPIGHPA